MQKETPSVAPALMSLLSRRGTPKASEALKLVSENCHEDDTARSTARLLGRPKMQEMQAQGTKQQLLEQSRTESFLVPDVTDLDRCWKMGTVSGSSEAGSHNVPEAVPNPLTARVSRGHRTGCPASRSWHALPRDRGGIFRGKRTRNQGTRCFSELHERGGLRPPRHQPRGKRHPGNLVPC